MTRRLALGYVALGLLVTAAVAISLVLGSDRSAAPPYAGLYTSGSRCLGGAGEHFTIDQSGQFVEFTGGPGGSFRLEDGRLQGKVECRKGGTAPIALRVVGKEHVVGTVAGAPVALERYQAPPSATVKRSPEDTAGRLLLAMAFIIVCARFAGAGMARIGQPRVMGEVLAGILLGPTLLGAIWPDAQAYLFPSDITPLLSAIAQVGLVFYLFLVGMEYDPTLIRGRLGQSTFISSTCVALPFGLGILAAVPLYTLFAPSDVRFAAFAVFVGVTLAITAFPVLARILVERRMLGKPVGALSLASAAIGDVAAWGLVALALAVAGTGSGLHALAVIGWTMLFVVCMVVLVKPFLGRAAAAYAEVGHLPIIWTGTIFVGVLLASFASQRAGVAPIFGAFIMGAVMPRNAGLSTDVSRRIDDFVGIILLPLFFAVSGLKVDITGLDSGLLWALTFAIIGLAVVGKWGGGYVASRFTGFSRRDSGVIGALMNTRGLTELIVLNIALSAGVISPKLFSMLVVMAIVTTLMAGPALRLLDPRRELSTPAEDELGQTEPGMPALRSIVVAPQDERNLDALLALAQPLAQSLPPRELVVVEALRSTSLVAGRLRDQDEVANATRRLEDKRRLLAQTGISARVAAFTAGDPGRDYVRIASREQVDLILVDGRRPLLGEGVPAGAVGRVLDEAPCDVAVLVERREAPVVDAAHPVAVPFGGAEHDWAALELGTAIASARGARLRLVGSRGVDGDAGRLLSHASTVVQGFTGVEVDSVLIEPGDRLVEATEDAGLLVLGLADGWRDQGLGPVRAEIARRATASVVFVRRGRGSGMLAPEGVDMTRVRWSSLEPAGPAGGAA
jgi:K+:H+ antiporter